MKEIVIPKEKAVFRMDADGVWHNVHGRFRHKRIIDHFNASIHKDEHGFYVYQKNGEIDEKVYFPYEVTAYFVVDVEIGESSVLLKLNTGKTMPLTPETLYVENDALYMKAGDDLVKFSSRALLRLAPIISCEAESCSIVLGDEHHEIEDHSSNPA